MKMHGKRWERDEKGTGKYERNVSKGREAWEGMGGDVKGWKGASDGTGMIRIQDDMGMDGTAWR